MNFKAIAASACVLTCCLGNPSNADHQSRKPWCTYSKHDHTITPAQGYCSFRQYGTNTGAMGATVYVTLADGTKLFFDGREQGETFQRVNRTGGIWLHREGDASLSVLWEKPEVSCAGV